MGKTFSCCRERRKKEDAYGTEVKLVAESVEVCPPLQSNQQISLQDTIQETPLHIDDALIQHLTFLLNHIQSNRSHSHGQLDIPEARLAGDGNEVAGGWTVVVRPISFIEGLLGRSHGDCFCIEWLCFKQIFDSRCRYQVLYSIHVMIHVDGTIITTVRFQICKTEALKNFEHILTHTFRQLSLPPTQLADNGPDMQRAVRISTPAQSVVFGSSIMLVSSVLVIRKPLTILPSAGGAACTTKKKRKRKAKEATSTAYTDIDALVDDLVSSALLNAAKAVAKKEKTKVKNKQRRRRMKERIKEERRQEKEAQRSREGTTWSHSVKLDVEWSYNKPPASKHKNRRS